MWLCHAVDLVWNKTTVDRIYFVIQSYFVATLFYENKLVQTFWLVLLARIRLGRAALRAGRFVLRNRFPGRGPAFPLCNRHVVWRLPFLRLHVSVARLGRRQDKSATRAGRP